MANLNYKLLKSNIRSLMEKRKVTQAQLAEITKMSQPNISKALNPEDKKNFTVDQLYDIAVYFGVSLDELVGNEVAEMRKTAPRYVLSLLVDLLCSDKARVTPWKRKEEVFILSEGVHGPSADHTYLEVEYPAIYFPSHYDFDGSDYEDEEVQERYSDFCMNGNETPFYEMNHIIKKLLPMIELYKDGEIPEEAFRMIVKGYLNEVPGI